MVYMAVEGTKLMAEFFSRTWFVWWIVAVVVMLRWLHVIAPNNSCNESQPDPNDEEFQSFTEYANSPWGEYQIELRR